MPLPLGRRPALSPLISMLRHTMFESSSHGRISARETWKFFKENAKYLTEQERSREAGRLGKALVKVGDWVRRQPGNARLGPLA